MTIDKEELSAVSQVVRRSDLGLDHVSNAKELTKVLYEASSDQITSLGRLSFPSAFVLDDTYCLLIDVNKFMTTEDEKDVLAALLRTMANNSSIIAIALSYEAWMVEATKEESRRIKNISTHPKKLEALVVHGEWRYSDDYLIFGRVLRGEDKKVIDILEVMSGPQNMSGRFSNLFVPLPFPGEPLN